MKITVISSYSFDTVYVGNLENLPSVETAGYYDLNTLALRYCSGCWDCWWKTPGKCAINDDIATIFRAMMRSDLVVYVSPLAMGTISCAMKGFIERQIPLIHPYVALVNKEFHHIKRYKKYPAIGAILMVEGSTDQEDMDINKEYFNRFCRNFYNKLNFINYASDALELISTLRKELEHEVPAY